MTSRSPWLVFAGALLVVVAVMAFVTKKIVTLDQDRQYAARRGAVEEQVRLALWRLDSQTTPLLVEEIAALGMLGDPRAESVLPPPVSPVRARFVVDAQAGVRIVGDDTTVDTQRLGALLETVAWTQRLPEPTERAFATISDGVAGERGAVGFGSMLSNPVLERAKPPLQLAQQTKGSYSEAEQVEFNQRELSRRVAAVNDNFAGYRNSLANTIAVSAGRFEGGPPPPAGAVRPVWLEDELFFVRRVAMEDGEAIHGTWVDWPALRDTLLAQIVDPLPEANLVAVADEELAADTTNLLATLPLRLLPGTADVQIEPASSLLPSLALGWAGVLAAIVAVFAVLRWSLALSERRAAFVSTVTHELRTPLTTFRMYTEMLQDGMVEPAKRTKYLATLRREADRLGELVENVLAYAQVESDRAPLNAEAIAVEALLARVQERLTERAARADLQLAVEIPTELASTTLSTDPAATEQILFNLVDNASKYGASTAEPRIVIDARRRGGRVLLGVRDFGPGIPTADRANIFEPFAKANADHSGTKPGVGLGLALCRRLARQLGGDLTIETAEPGARFVVSLPCA